MWAVPSSGGVSAGGDLCPAGEYAAKIAAVREVQKPFKAGPGNEAGDALEVVATVQRGVSHHRLESLIGKHQEALLGALLSAAGCRLSPGTCFQPSALVGKSVRVEVGHYNAKSDGKPRHCVRKWLKPAVTEDSPF